MTDAEMRFTNGELAALIGAAKIMLQVGEADDTDLRWLKSALAKLEADLASRL